MQLGRRGWQNRAGQSATNLGFSASQEPPSLIVLSSYCLTLAGHKQGPRCTCYPDLLQDVYAWKAGSPRLRMTWSRGCSLSGDDGTLGDLGRCLQRAWIAELALKEGSGVCGQKPTSRGIRWASHSRVWWWYNYNNVATSNLDPIRL